MEKSSYHHGDLSRALVEAATKALEVFGQDAVTLRGLAEGLGVSRAAPYRHFADRDGLLAAVAARGFDDLNAGYEAALAGPGDGRAKLRQATRFYMDFAERRPGLHRLMFESDFLSRSPPPAVLIPAADRAYQLLLQTVSAAFPNDLPAQVKARTLTIWSTTYGFLALRGAGRFKPFMREPLTDSQIEEAVIGAITGEGSSP